MTRVSRREAPSRVKRIARRAGLTRARLASTVACFERQALAWKPETLRARQSRILCYHSVGTPSWGINDVSPSRFARQMEVILERGWHFVPASRIADGLAGPMDIAVTFDDGLASVANALPVLRSYRIPYTLFVVSGWLEGHAPGFGPVFMSWRDVEEHLAAGAQVGSHTVTHRNLAALSLDEAEEELTASRRTIAARTGIAPDEFAIPFGTSRDWNESFLRSAHEAGYRHVYAQSEALRARGTVPRTFITHWDSDRLFRAALDGRFDYWEERI